MIAFMPGEMLMNMMRRCRYARQCGRYIFGAFLPFDDVTHHSLLLWLCPPVWHIITVATGRVDGSPCVTRPCVSLEEIDVRARSDDNDVLFSLVSLARYVIHLEVERCDPPPFNRFRLFFCLRTRQCCRFNLASISPRCPWPRWQGFTGRTDRPTPHRCSTALDGHYFGLGGEVTVQ